MPSSRVQWVALQGTGQEMRGGCCKETHADGEEEYDCRKAGKSRADLSAVRELTMGMIADCLGKHRSTRYSH